MEYPTPTHTYTINSFMYSVVVKQLITIKEKMIEQEKFKRIQRTKEK